MAVVEGQLLWTPSAETVLGSNISKYLHWLREYRGISFSEYSELWQWSVDDTAAFWGSLWDYFQIETSAPYKRVVSGLEMRPGVSWFEGSRVNLAEHILRNEQADKTAIYHCSELRPLETLSWQSLARKVRVLSTRMRKMGVQPGDRVCGLMPNMPETVIAMLAAISIGAVWSNAAPEFGSSTILDRFSQIRPKWLFVVDGYRFAGKDFDKRKEFSEIIDALSDSLKQVVYLPYLYSDRHELSVDAVLWDTLLTGNDPGDEFLYERVANDHPVWVLFSSGTTGLPKAIVHNHTGVLIELQKLSHFHLDLHPSDTAFFYTTTGWVMFNLLVAMMLTGASIVLFDGSPTSPKADVLWKIASETRTTIFGTSPAYVGLMEQQSVDPTANYDLSALRSVLCGGSPASPDVFAWFYDNVKTDLWVTSQSGGTEIVSGFVVASPTLPVRAGEIQCRALGMDVDAWDKDGESVRGKVGELVCKTPFPSMPLYFIGDENSERYNATYFADFPGVWHHGDFLKIQDHGGCYIYGRSDATLNRYGVRIGTAELYRVIEQLDTIDDSLVVCVELPGGKCFMPMFLQLAPGHQLTEELEELASRVLLDQCSPRHVPDRYYAIPEVPYTLTGKKMEIPVRKLLMGWRLEEAASVDMMRNPRAIEFFLNYVVTTEDYSVPKRI